MLRRASRGAVAQVLDRDLAVGVLAAVRTPPARARPCRWPRSGRWRRRPCARRRWPRWRWPRPVTTSPPEKTPSTLVSKVRSLTWIGLPAGEVQRLAEGQEVGDPPVHQLLHAACSGRWRRCTKSQSMRNSEPRIGFGLRRPLCVGLAQLHAEALQPRDPAVLLAQHPHGRDEEVHLHALVLRLHDLHLVGRHLLARAPVEDAHLGGAQAQGGARAVDGGVAAAHHQHPAVDVDPGACRPNC